MPCDSRIRNVGTNMKDVERLKHALAEAGLEVTYSTEDKVQTDEVTFTRRGESFTATADYYDIGMINQITRAYAEIGMRTWVQRRGYTISREGEKFIVQNRRG